MTLLSILAVAGFLCSGIITVVGSMFFLDSWSEGDSRLTLFGVCVFLMGLTSLLAITLPMMKLMEVLKGAQ